MTAAPHTHTELRTHGAGVMQREADGYIAIKAHGQQNPRLHEREKMETYM